MRSRESHLDSSMRHASMSFGMLGMAGITLLQAVHNKSLVIVAETCMPFELGAATIYGRLALKNAQAAFQEPIPGCNNPPLIPEAMPDPTTFAQRIGLEG